MILSLSHFLKQFVDHILSINALCRHMLHTRSMPIFTLTLRRSGLLPFMTLAVKYRKKKGSQILRTLD